MTLSDSAGDTGITDQSRRFLFDNADIRGESVQLEQSYR